MVRQYMTPQQLHHNKRPCRAQCPAEYNGFLKYHQRLGNGGSGSVAGQNYLKYYQRN
jgi:hypothetical protein